MRHSLTPQTETNHKKTDNEKKNITRIDPIHSAIFNDGRIDRLLPFYFIHL